MKNISKHQGVLRIIQREKSSVNGNPRYLCFIDNGEGTGFSFVTQVDHTHGYSITNYENKKVIVEIGTLRNKAQLNRIELLKEAN